MATDLRGHTVPANTGHPARSDVTNLGLSVRDPIPVPNATARSALIVSLGSVGITASTSNPIYVFRADAPAGRELEYTVNGTTWTAIPAGPYLMYTTTATTAADGTFSGAFPAGFFSVAPVVVASAESNTQFAFAAAAATSTVAFAGHCGYFATIGGASSTTSGFVVAILAIQATPTTAVG
ncbi:MAG: hypothetical protein M0Z51_17010 [Propionibacterium sp.]|nr:hypothetical protein [Propionibacterium sp.]